MNHRMNQLLPLAFAIGAVLTFGAACATSGTSSSVNAETSTVADAGAAGQTGAINLAIAMPVPLHVANEGAVAMSGR
jgi:hypothetical protein